MQKNLERAVTAESVGVSSIEIQKLIDSLVENGIEPHSFMVLRHGKVAAEAYAEPFHKESVHMAFSISKSFLSAAYGFALNEGLLTRETKFLDVFPELRPKRKDPFLEKLTIHHLFSMTSGKRTHRGGKHWLRAFVKAKWDFEPGTSFRYVNENYSTAAAVLTRVTGMSVTEYLTPRLYEPLRMDIPLWETSPDGIEAGGWGLLLKTEDIAKFILCCHNGGNLFGKQIIPEDYIREATSKLNDSSVSQTDADSAAGYGLGFWQCAGYPGTFRCEGLFSQYAISFKEEDACLILTSAGNKLQKTLDIIWKHMKNAFIPTSLSSDGSPVSIPAFFVPSVSMRSPLETTVGGNVYRLNKSRFVDACGYPIGVLPMQITFFSKEKGGDISDLRFEFTENAVTMTWLEKKRYRNCAVLPLDGSLGKSKIQIGELDMETVGCALWRNENTLEVNIRSISATVTRRFIFTF
ncbi:MAG: serine hydrolase domain-containing protein, partial [Acutalibacteraceae bacterium]